MDNFSFEITCDFEKKELSEIVRNVSNIRMKSIDIKDFQKFSKLMIVILMSYFLWEVFRYMKYTFPLVKFSIPIVLFLRVNFLPILMLLISLFLILNLKYQQFFMQKIYNNFYMPIFLIKNKYIITNEKIEYTYFCKPSKQMHFYFKDIRNILEFKDNDVLVLLFHNKSILPIKLDKKSENYNIFIKLCLNRTFDYI